MPFAAVDQSTASPGPNAFQSLLLAPDQSTQIWSNQALPNATSGEGSETNPLSYNVMPLPQAATSDPPSPSPDGFILKNFSYYERIQFTGGGDTSANIPIPAGAPNRGEGTLQIPFALFYDQRVRFAEGPGIGTTVHVENGAWLNLESGPAVTGPYPDFMVDSPNQQPADRTIAKQMSVPHGNSILALGSFSGPTAVPSGGLAIADASLAVLPTRLQPPGPDVSTEKYTATLDGSDDYENPSPDLTANPLAPLQQAVGLIQPTHYYLWSVDSGNSGQVVNIPYETTASDVTSYQATYWLLSTDGGQTFDYLAYVQVINMTFTIPDSGGTPVRYNFPHVTANVVTRGVASGTSWPTSAGS